MTAPTLQRSNAPTIILCIVLLAACDRPGDDFEQIVASGVPVDVWIRGGAVIDGSGSQARDADVLIRGDSIVYVGAVDADRVEAETVIEADGKIVAPGFIDPHSHGNPLGAPEMRNFLAMGVTTITLGQDGSSPRYRNLEVWMDSVDAARPAANVATFVGHGTIRRMSGIGNNDNPTPAQIDSMTALLASQLADGAFGLSTGLEYTPGAYADDSELVPLAAVAGEAGTTVMSHMRTEDNDVVESAIRELLRQGEHAAVHVSHLKVVYGKGADRAGEIRALLDSARTAGITVTADVYPYTASYTGIGIVFPLWAKGSADYEDVVRTRRDELEEYIRNRVTLRNGPDATLIGTGEFAGRTLAEVANQLEKPFEDLLIDDFGPSGFSGAYFVMDETLQQTLAQDPHVMFSSDGSEGGYHPRGHGTFAKVIEDYVVGERLMPLEEAIRKMTSLTASVIGISDRGLLEAGYRADIVIFDPTEVHATATYAEPHQLAEGFDYVLVNGEAVIAEGEFTGDRPGRMLRR